MVPPKFQNKTVLDLNGGNKTTEYLQETRELTPPPPPPKEDTQYKVSPSFIRKFGHMAHSNQYVFHSVRSEHFKNLLYMLPTKQMALLNVKSHSFR